MSTAYGELVNALFQTKALRVCPENKPFWYTSGTIGPYYINTHFLYGSEEKANKLLTIIDELKDNILECPLKVLELARENYNKESIYRNLMDEMCTYVKKSINLNEVDFISGGERRDWFFSLLAAEMLKKPHITVYKDLTAVVSGNGNVQVADNLKGRKVLHVADLITEASSYERAWIPAVKNRGGEIKWSTVVVDRNQGGKEILESKGIESYAMVYIGKQLFDKAVEMGLINKEQYSMILDFIDNPKESMKRFLKQNPRFLTDALNSDEKTRERARLCIEKNIYELR